MPLSLVKRLVLGVPIPPSTEDDNKTKIEQACNGFEAELAVSLNPDGTLKANSINTAAIQDRSVTLAKLDFVSEFWAEDTGAANALLISFTPHLVGGYVKGMAFWVKVIASNTGASTLNVDANGPIAIKKFVSSGMIDLIAGDMIIGGEYIFIYDGTEFILANPTAIISVPPVAYNSSGPVLQSTGDIDLQFFLPTGRKWNSVEMRSVNVLDSASTASVSCTTTFKWNCGTFLDTPVTLGALNGAGNTPRSLSISNDAITEMFTEFTGIVPSALVSVSPLKIRASITFGGDTSDTLGRNWMFWAKATTQ